MGFFFFPNYAELANLQDLSTQSPGLCLHITPVAHLEVPIITLRFENSLKGFSELTEDVVIPVMVYYKKGCSFSHRGGLGGFHTQSFRVSRMLSSLGFSVWQDTQGSVCQGISPT